MYKGTITIIKHDEDSDKNITEDQPIDFQEVTEDLVKKIVSAIECLTKIEGVAHIRDIASEVWTGIPTPREQTTAKQETNRRRNLVTRALREIEVGSKRFPNPSYWRIFKEEADHPNHLGKEAWYYL